MEPSRDITRLLEIMARLRTPGEGCPWDLEQSFATIAPYTIEEAYEVADAIARKDLADLRDELGDLLLQVVFHARMAEEIGAFDFGDVVSAITAKLVRRHPHVFDIANAPDPQRVKKLWEEIKQAERAERAREHSSDRQASSVLDGVPAALPALTRAVKLQKKAGSVGFDWNDPRAVLSKLREEIDEIEAELGESGTSQERVADEVGDLLFAATNLARHLDVDPESALRGANRKFERRFRTIECALAQAGRMPQEASLEEMEALWRSAKRAECDEEAAEAHSTGA